MCFSVNVSVCFVCCMFASVCEFFCETIRNIFAILLLNVIEVFSVCGGILLIDHVWSSNECVCCACDPYERLNAPSICFVCVFVCRKSAP